MTNLATIGDYEFTVRQATDFVPFAESTQDYRERGGVVHRRDPWSKTPKGLCCLTGGIVSTTRTHVNCLQCRAKMKKN